MRAAAAHHPASHPGRSDENLGILESWAFSDRLTAVLEQVGPEHTCSGRCRTLGAAVFISHTNIHTHTHTHSHTHALTHTHARRPGLSRGRGPGSVVSVSGTEWLSQIAASGMMLRGNERTCTRWVRTRCCQTVPLRREPPRKECAAWRVFL